MFIAKQIQEKLLALKVKLFITYHVRYMEYFALQTCWKMVCYRSMTEDSGTHGKVSGVGSLAVLTVARSMDSWRGEKKQICQLYFTYATLLKGRSLPDNFHQLKKHGLSLFSEV